MFDEKSKDLTGQSCGLKFAPSLAKAGVKTQSTETHAGMEKNIFVKYLLLYIYICQCTQAGHHNERSGLNSFIFFFKCKNEIIQKL